MKKKQDINRLESLRKELQFSDRGIFEKAVYTFNLLSELLHIYPNLIFKGGTSVLLHIFPPARLSIDIGVKLMAGKIELADRTRYENVRTQR